MSLPELRGADVIAYRLANAGCGYAFGIPGGEVLTLVDALRAAGLRFVVVRHENSGGFMAEGTYHATGAPGVVVATVGPGVANLLNVVANAQQDRVPLIVLSGCLDASLTPTFSHQVFDHRAVLSPVCKASFRVETGAVSATVDKAVRIAMAGRPGPVHLDVPMAVAEASEAMSPGHPDVAALRAAPEALSDARELLQRAERPVLFIGNDVLVQKGEGLLRAVAERTGVPTVTTYKAKGIVDEDSESCLGAAGLSPKADGLLLPWVARADVALLAGYDAIEMRAGWRDPFLPTCTVIQLDATFDTQYLHRPSRILHGDIAENLDAITRGWTAKGTWRDGQTTTTRQALHQAFSASPSDSLDARSVTGVVQELAVGARITVDTGAHRILASQMLRRSLPRLMHQSTGLCTMGCALPVAIGAALADPHRTTVALVGDGGFEMVVGELATARDLDVNLTVVIYDDRSLALIEKKQRARGLVNVGVDFGASVDFAGTDYDSVARGFGARGITVDTVDGFRAALHAALEAPGVDILTCRIPRRDYDDAI